MGSRRRLMGGGEADSSDNSCTPLVGVKDGATFAWAKDVGTGVPVKLHVPFWSKKATGTIDCRPYHIWNADATNAMLHDVEAADKAAAASSAPAAEGGKGKAKECTPHCILSSWLTTDTPPDMANAAGRLLVCRLFGVGCLADVVCW